MDLKDYLHVVRRSWALILAIALAGLLGGGALSILSKPTYAAQTELFVAIQSSGSISELQQGNTFSQGRVQSYVKTVSTPVVLQPVIDSLGLNVSADQLAKQVKASTDLDTVVINISVVDNSPVQAAAIAQATGNSLIKVVDDLERPKLGGASPVKLSVITPATPPGSPTTPNTRLNLVLGVCLGLVAGLALALGRKALDSKVRGESDVLEVSSSPILGGIAFDSDASRKPLLTQAPQHSRRAESYRQLRTNLQFANISGHAKTVLVTSSLPGEGKSTTAINLAIALAQAGQSVCLVDADLRRPMVGEYLGLDATAGLTTALVGAADVNELLHVWGGDNLCVLTSGRIPPNPSELLGSEEMSGLIKALEQAFDIVIIDAPPLLPVTDAAVLAQHVGGVAVVVGAQRIKRQDLEKSLRALELVGANILGLVLNLLPGKGPDSYAYTYYAKDSSLTTEKVSSSRRSKAAPEELAQDWARNDARGRESRFPAAARFTGQDEHVGD